MKNLFFTFFAVFFFSTTIAQTTWTVVNTSDSGFGSLRAAADSAVAGDTIRFSPSLIANGSDSIVLTSGEVAIDSIGIVIKGVYNSIDTLFVSGGQSSRIFSFSGAGRVVLDSLILRNGRTLGIFPLSHGGAIKSTFATDTLFVTNSKIYNNVAVDGHGGGIYSESVNSIVFIVNSVISGNRTTKRFFAQTNRFGGGVYSLGNTLNCTSYVMIKNSTIYGNTAEGIGAGVYSSSRPGSDTHSSLSTVVITGSTITGNKAKRDGGGVYVDSGCSASVSPQAARSTVEVTNSTISGNTSGGYGGGVSVYSFSLRESSTFSSVLIANATISGNTASSSGGGIYSSSYGSSVSSSVLTSSSSSVEVINSTVVGNTTGTSGGGVYSSSFSSAVSNLLSKSSVSVINSTLFGNSANQYGSGIYSMSSAFVGSDSSEITIGSSNVADYVGNTANIYNTHSPTIISNGFNLFSDAPMGALVSDSTNVTAAQLNLQPLDFNRGTTQTMLPGINSIALDNGNPNDNSDAQNAPIVGTRNVGAAENCFVLISSSISVTNCYSYTVPSGDTTYSQSGIYKDTMITVCGADSVITINLTINPTQYEVDVISSCSPITWINGTVYNQTITGPIVTFSNSLGCDSIVVLNFTLLEADTSVTRNYLTLTAQASNASYQWIDCANGVITGETDASFTATVNGSYQVEITQNGCVDTSACFTITNVGVLETELLGISLYPNPTSDVLNIDKGNNASLEITITNSAGSIVYQSTSKSQITTVGMSKMATGMYVVTMKNELGMKVEKVVKR